MIYFAFFCCSALLCIALNTWNIFQEQCDWISSESSRFDNENGRKLKKEVKSLAWDIKIEEFYEVEKVKITSEEKFTMGHENDMPPTLKKKKPT